MGTLKRFLNRSSVGLSAGMRACANCRFWFHACRPRRQHLNVIHDLLGGQGAGDFRGEFGVAEGFVEEAQGAGLGAAVWQALIHRCPRLYWRSRTDNPVTAWYFDQADASFTEDKWVTFSVGIDDFNQLCRCKNDCLARSESWVEKQGV